MDLYVPSETILSSSWYGYRLDRCSGSWQGSPPTPFTEVAKKFLSTRGLRHAVRPPTDKTSETWFYEHVGHSYYTGDGPIPSLKVDLGIRYKPQKGSRTRKAFKEMKKNGSIVLSNRLIGGVVVKDFVIPDTPRTGRVQHRLVPSYASVISQSHPCTNSSSQWFPFPHTGEFYFHATDRSPNGHYSPVCDGVYDIYRDVSLTTLATRHGTLVGTAANTIAEQLLSQDIDRGLVTSSTAELNASIYDALTELAELPETVKMIVNAIKTALKMFINAKRGERTLKREFKSNAAELTQRTAELWMAYRYGIMPIVYSIQDGMDYLNQHGLFYRTVRRGLNIDAPLDVPGWTLTGLDVARHRYFGKARLEQGRMTGLGFNPITTAWELVPLSFVVDWFLNIGDLLGSLSPSIDMTESGVTYSKKFSGRVMGTHPSIPVPVPFDVDLYQRQIINPQTHVGITFEPLLTMKRQLDAIALSWMMFAKDFRRVR